MAWKINMLSLLGFLELPEGSRNHYLLLQKREDAKTICTSELFTMEDKSPIYSREELKDNMWYALHMIQKRWMGPVCSEETTKFFPAKVTDPEEGI